MGQRPSLPLVKKPEGFLRVGVTHQCVCGIWAHTGHFNQCKTARADEMLQRCIITRLQGLVAQLTGEAGGSGVTRPDPRIQEELGRLEYVLPPPIHHGLLTAVRDEIVEATVEELVEWTEKQEKRYFLGGVTLVEGYAQLLLQGEEEVPGTLAWRAPKDMKPRLGLGPGWTPPVCLIIDAIRRAYGGEFDLLAPLWPITAESVRTHFVRLVKNGSGLAPEVPVIYSPRAPSNEEREGQTVTPSLVLLKWGRGMDRAAGEGDIKFLPGVVYDGEDEARAKLFEVLDQALAGEQANRGPWEKLLKDEVAAEAPQEEARSPEPEDDGDWGEFFGGGPEAAIVSATPVTTFLTPGPPALMATTSGGSASGGKAQRPSTPSGRRRTPKKARKSG